MAMLRQGLRSLALQARPFTTSSVLRAEEVASKHTSSAFVEAWAKAAPANLDFPNLPANNLPASTQEAGGPIPEKLTFNFYMPHAQELVNEKVGGALIAAGGVRDGPTN